MHLEMYRACIAQEGFFAIHCSSLGMIEENIFALPRCAEGLQPGTADFFEHSFPRSGLEAGRLQTTECRRLSWTCMGAVKSTRFEHHDASKQVHAWN